MNVKVSGIQITPDDKLMIAYDKPAGGSLVQTLSFDDKGCRLAKDLVMDKEFFTPSVIKGYTQFKKRDGKIFFLSNNRLMSLSPSAEDKITEAWDPKIPRGPIESFAFDDKGDIYMGSNNGFFRHKRGANLYYCQKQGNSWEKPVGINNNKPLVAHPYYIPADLAVDTKNRVYLRLEDKYPDHKRNQVIYIKRVGHKGVATPRKAHSTTVSICRYSPKSGKIKEFAWLGGSVAQSPLYGLHIARNGKVYIAGGDSRSISCYSEKGKKLWESRFFKDQRAGSVPLRQPLGITVDSKGYVWVADAASNKILCFDSNGKFLKAYGHFGTIDDVSGFAFCRPVGIATIKDQDGTEWLYVADINNQRIVKFKINHN